MTKRQWRRARGRIFNKFNFTALSRSKMRKLKFRSMIMSDISQSLLYPKPRNKEYDKFYFG